MASRQLRFILDYVKRLAASADGSLTNGRLLEQFIVDKDEAAFATLVERHGPMVLGVCRRLLHNPDDIDDAFQATFLVLATKARSISKRASVGSWLYGVAYRVALRAQAQTGRSRTKSRPLADYVDERQEEAVASAARRELRAVLDEELSRLPEKYRAPLVLCDAEGRSWSMAARELCLAVGTLQRRLHRGRTLLRVRLVRRGVVLPAAALTAALAADGSAAMPPVLAGATTRLALLLAAGQTTGQGISAAALAEGVMKTMPAGKLKFAAVLMLLTVTIAGIGIAGVEQQAQQPPSAPAANASAESPRTQTVVERTE